MIPHRRRQERSSSVFPLVLRGRRLLLIITFLSILASTCTIQQPAAATPFLLLVDALAPALFSSSSSTTAALSAYHHRAQQQNNNSFVAYQTQHLRAEHCRFLSPEACRRDDQAHVKKKRLRKQQQQQQQQAKQQQLRRQRQDDRPLRQAARQLNPSTMNGGNLDGDPTKAFRVLVILCQFQDHAANTNWMAHLPSRDYFETLFNGNNGTNPSTDPFDMSIAEYLRFNSVNRYRVEFNVLMWQTTNNTEAYYSQGQAGRVGLDELQHVFTPILDQLDMDGFDWSLYDQASDDGSSGADGILDHLVVIHSGAGAEFGNAPPGTGSCSYTSDIVIAPYLDRIWSQGAGTVANPWTSTGGIQLGGFTIAGAFDRPLCDMVRIIYACKCALHFLLLFSK
jgi:Immune inhibitor A peptidase M6